MLRTSKKIPSPLTISYYHCWSHPKASTYPDNLDQDILRVFSTLIIYQGVHITYFSIILRKIISTIFFPLNLSIMFCFGFNGITDNWTKLETIIEIHYIYLWSILLALIRYFIAKYVKMFLRILVLNNCNCKIDRFHQKILNVFNDCRNFW